MDKAFAELFKSERWDYTDEYADKGRTYHFDPTWDIPADEQMDVEDDITVTNLESSPHPAQETQYLYVSTD